jgi:hypothetical protein
MRSRYARQQAPMNVNFPVSENSVDCQECGLVFADIPPVSIPRHLADAARGYRRVLRAASAADLTFRTSETTCSALEYACHVRDVLLNLRDRVVLALVEEATVWKANSSPAAGSMPGRTSMLPGSAGRHCTRPGITWTTSGEVSGRRGELLDPCGGWVRRGR